MSIRQMKHVISASSIVAVLGLVAGSGAIYAQDAEYRVPEAAQATAEQLMERALASDLGYRIVESLTTEIGPRLAGSPAEARARSWAERMLNAQGFENVRIETFSVPQWERGEIEVSVVSPFPQDLAATALGMSTSSPRRGLEAEVVLFDSLGDLMDADEGSLDGKIAFVNDAMTRTQTGTGYGPAVAKRGVGWVEASKRGAEAVIIRSVGTDENRFPHTGGTRRPDQFEDVDPIPAVAISVPDANNLARMIDRGSPVIVRLRSTARVRGEAPSGNVIGEIRGRERPDEIVVIGAHLDSWDLGTGAIDDGAGVAIVTAAAKLISELPQAPKRTIRVVLYGSEEIGLFGGRAYADARSDELMRHVVAAESDFGAGRVWRFNMRVGAGALPAVRAMGRTLKSIGVDLGVTEICGGPDITPLSALGVPVVGLAQNGWDYFDTHHTANDTLERIDRQDLAQNVAAYAAFAYLAAETDVDFRADANGNPTSADGYDHVCN